MATRAAKILKGTPKAGGYRFPAEWERHAGTWFSWPRPEGISFPGRYHTVPANLAAIISEIWPRELVHINVPNENYQRIVTEQLIAGGVSKQAFSRKRIVFHFILTNESWCRDHGPAFVTRKGRSGKHEFAIVDWGFNAWGGKYPPFDADDAVPSRIGDEYAAAGKSGFQGVFLPTHADAQGPKGRRGVIMEGGSVEFNGKGTVLTSEACLLNSNRNPKLSKSQIEKHLRDYYGQEHVIWVEDGIEGDDTDGHIDDTSRFVSPTTIVTAMESDPKDPNHRILKHNRRRLELARDQDGRPFEIVDLPMPKRIDREGQRLPASYANFYFVNGAVLVPIYRDRKNDARALDILSRAIPNRKVIGIDCFELIWGLGAIHCLTQQVPAGC